MHLFYQRIEPRSVEADLRLLPGFAAGLQPLFARFGEMQLFSAAVGRGCFNLDQSIALERKNVAAERGAIHDHFLGQGVDRHWAEPFQLCQNRKLRHVQSNGGQELIVKLRHVAGCGADHETIAVLRV